MPVRRFVFANKPAPACATSILKSQGFEYPAVVITLPGQHFVLSQQNPVCTAVTLGRRHVFIVLEKRRRPRRCTTLTQQLSKGPG